MSTETITKAGIEKTVSTYALWTIGVTSDPETLEFEPGSLAGWHRWDADSDQIARNVKQHFVSKGMGGERGGLHNSVSVYIFLGIN